MGATYFSTSNALTKKAWEEKLVRDVVKESFFAPFLTAKDSSPIQVVTQLEKGKGDKVTTGLRMRLANAGVTSGQQLSGNEEALTTYDCSVSLEEYAHAVLTRGPLDEQRAMFSIDAESTQALKDWMTEKIDALIFSALFGTGSHWFHRIHGSSGLFGIDTAVDDAATAAGGTNAVLTPSFIQQLKVWAETGGLSSGSRIRVPLRPIKIEGKNHYVLLVHPDSLYQLKQDTTFWIPAMKDAMERGKDNPIISGAEAIYDGVVIRSHESVPYYTGSTTISKFALLGQQALIWAWGRRPIVVQEDKDYKRQKGYSIQMISGVAKSVYNSLDYGSMVGVVYNVSISQTSIT